MKAKYGVEMASGTDPFDLENETLGLYETPKAACDAIDAFCEEDRAEGFTTALYAEGYVRMNKVLDNGETMTRSYSIYIKE